MAQHESEGYVSFRLRIPARLTIARCSDRFFIHSCPFRGRFLTYGGGADLLEFSPCLCLLLLPLVDRQRPAVRSLIVNDGYMIASRFEHTDLVIVGDIPRHGWQWLRCARSRRRASHR